MYKWDFLLSKDHNVQIHIEKHLFTLPAPDV